MDQGPPEPVPLRMPGSRGPASALYDPPSTGGTVVICVGGFDGGFDGPADGLYPALAADLATCGAGVMRLDFRDRRSPGVVEHGAADVLAGLAELRRRGVEKIALVGHSFGAAVMITVGGGYPDIATVVALSTQTAGAEAAAKLSCPLLLIHGLEDRRLPPDCSRRVFALAKEPKQLILLEGARHSLRQRSADVRRIVREWLIEKLDLDAVT